MSYNIETGARSLVYRTEWDVVNSYLSKKDSYRVITVNEDAQNKIIVNDSKDGSSLKFKGLDNLNINSVAFSDDETLIRINAASSNSPGDIYVYSLLTDELKKITSNLNSKVDPSDLVSGEVIRYKSFDGIEIPAILYKPHSAKKGAKVPALVWVHGGPGGQ